MLTGMKPIDHFRELVSTAMAHQKVKTNEFVEHYLTTLLAEQVLSRSLSEEPLAITYLKALGSGRVEQARLLKQTGDAALFTSGFFSDSLKRKVVDLDYYVLIGRASYGYLAGSRSAGSLSAIASIFAELAGRFAVFVDVLTEVSERSRLTTSKDVLRVYERWLRTKSSKAASLLRSLGIEPVEAPTDVQ